MAWLLAAAASVASLAGQSSVSGRAFLVEAGKTRPIGGVMVVASGGSPRAPRAYAETNGRGEFVIEGLAAGLWSFQAQSAEYYAVRAGGADAEEAARSCPNRGVCAADLDFELARAAATEGWLTDSWGEPLSGVRAALVRGDSELRTQPGAHLYPSETLATDITDDEGYFRLYGLRPGRYTVLFQPVVLIAGETDLNVPPVTIEISGGESAAPLRVAAPAVLYFRLAGQVEGLPAADSAGYRVVIEPKPPADSLLYSFVGMRRPLEGGRFDAATMPAGEYMLSLVRRAAGAATEERRLLGFVNLDRDLPDLTLRPHPPAVVEAAVEWKESLPARIGVRLVPAGNEGAIAWMSFTPQEPVQRLENVLPGRYRVRSSSPELYIESPQELNLGEGGAETIVIRVGTEWCRLRGRLRLGENEQAASHRVALRGGGDVLDVVADDQGRFEFARVAPGNYELASWADSRVDVNSDAAWERARATVKAIELEPGFEVEVELRATP